MHVGVSLSWGSLAWEIQGFKWIKWHFTDWGEGGMLPAEVVTVTCGHGLQLYMQVGAECAGFELLQVPTMAKPRCEESTWLTLQ